MNIGEEFFEKTKYPFLSESDQNKELPCPPLETPQSGEAIDLPDPAGLTLEPVSLAEAVNNRRSRRKFSRQPLSPEELSWLLWATQGVREQGEIRTVRTVPSAGSRHPFDTFLAITNVTGLKPGLYRYLALSHQLVLIREDRDINARLAAICVNQKWIAAAAVSFIWVAVPYRSAWRYSERAWRYLLLDAGHVCQNLYLACEAIEAGCCAVNAYDDDALNRFLGLDGKSRFAIYLAPAGHR
jgi:SagB-type dehydrogenase family enzyme